MKKPLLILFLIPFLFSCQKKRDTSDVNRVVNLSILSPIRSLDPRISNDHPSGHVINMLYEGLMRLGPNGEILPGVARSVDISEDRCRYTFHLRDSCWSNGDPITAYDFEYAWKKSVDPLTARNGAFTFYAIKNVEACLLKKVSINEVGVNAIDERTLEVVLEHPAPYFLSLCACSTYSPIHKKFDLEAPQWANSVNYRCVGNGPFSLKRWKKGVEIYLEKNPLYWDADVVAIPGICIQVVTDANTQFLLFEKGKLDWVGQPLNPLPVEVMLSHQDDEKLEQIDAHGLSWFFVNTEKPPFNNKNMRKAVSYALNRDAIAKHIFQLGEQPAMGILNGGLSLQSEPYFEDGNTLLAQELFAKALEEMEMTKEEFPPIVMSQRSDLFTTRVTQAVQEQLRKVLGINLEIDQVDWPVHFNRMTKGDYVLGEMLWYSWLRDPIYMLDTFRSRSLATNMSRWEHSHYQELLTLSDNEIDPIKRKEYLRQAEEFLMEEMPVIPLCFFKLHYMHNDRLKCVYISPLKEIDFRYAYFEPE